MAEDQVSKFNAEVAKLQEELKLRESPTEINPHQTSKPVEYRSVLSSFPDLSFVVNPDGIIIDFFTRDENTLFVPPSQFMYKHYNDFLPPEIAEKTDKAFREAMLTGKVSSMVYTLPYNTHPEHFEGRFAPLRVGEGAVYVVRNITKQIITEEKLKSLSYLHHLIVEFSSLLVQSNLDEIDKNINITLKMLGEYTQVDRVYIFEYVAVEDVVNNTYEWCSEDINPEIENLQGVPFDAVPRWKEKFANKEHVYIPLVSEIDEQYHVEKAILEPQGIVSLLTLPMFYGDKLVGFIGFDSVKSTREWSNEHINLLRLAGEIIAGTISRGKFEKEIIMARRDAEKANKSKTEFLASMSHEIRTPMSAILGFSEILHNNVNDEKSKNYLSGILSSGKTLLHLINDILDLSKIEAGQMEVNREPTQICEILNEIEKIFSAKLQEKQLTFNIFIEKDFPQVIIIDDVRLRQILFNVVGNAVKFTHKGNVSLSAKQININEEGGHFDIEIAISDTGIGIPKSLQQTIFEAFVQVDGNNTRQYGGTGLGLAITARLLKMMNGTIEVESEPDKGSTFTITLRDVQSSDFMPTRKSIFDWVDKNIVFEPAKILVIDDVDFNRELVNTFLMNFNITVYEAKSAREGISLATLHQPDLILMDLRMPEMNGYQATRILREQPETKHIPCVAFTASTMKSEELEINQLFDDFLLKPLTRNELIDVLIKILPHTISEPGASSQDSNAKHFAFELFAKNPELLEKLIDDLESDVSPHLKNLLIYMDADIAEKLTTALKKIDQKYKINFFAGSAELLTQAVENFDFDLFNRELKTLMFNIQKMTNQTNQN